MKVVGLIDEDIVNYKKTSMYIAFPFCSFKCERECGKEICQNAQDGKSVIIFSKTEENAGKIVDLHL